MKNESKAKAISAEIAKETSDGNFYRFAGDNEKCMESFDNVEALQLKKADVALQAARELMFVSHAVVHIDHHRAQILQLDAERAQASRLKAHDAQPGGSGVGKHEFFGQVCDELSGIREVLVTGPQTALRDFRHFVDTHRVQAASHIVGWESANRPSEDRLIAFARQFFVKYDRTTCMRSA